MNNEHKGGRGFREAALLVAMVPAEWKLGNQTGPPRDCSSQPKSL